MNYGINLKKNRGIILIACYLVVALLMVLVGALVARSVYEAKFAERQQHLQEAFYIAESGLQQVIFDLRADYANTAGWGDGAINGMAIALNTNTFTTLPYLAAQTAVGQGDFQVGVKGVLGKPAEVWIQSTGTSGSYTRRVQAYLAVKNLNTWNNVIFAGSGQGGNAISGNVDIRGSVHILGTGPPPLTSNDYAMDLSGGANLGNNYTGMPVELSSRIPAIPIVNFNGENVESLSAEIRFKNGKLGLSGIALAGAADVTGNSVKETMDGMFVTHGYGGNQATANVYSDNGTGNAYDAGDVVYFPIFSKPYVDRRDSSSYPNYGTFLTTKGLDISAVPEIPNGKIDPRNVAPGPGTPSFCLPITCLQDANQNLIQWDNPSKTLTVQGVVYRNGDIDLGEKNTEMYFLGKGTLVARGPSADVDIHGNFLAKGPEKFATLTGPVIGLVAEDKVRIGTGGGESQLKVMGAFYGQTEIEADKQAYLAGTFNSNHFKMNQVPSIYQVPSLVDNLPPGLIGDQTVFIIQVKSWQEI